jgi:MFS family permease
MKNIFHSLRGARLYWLMKIVCGVSFMMYGYDAGVLGGVLLHPPFLDAIGLNNPGPYTIPLIVSAYSLSACITALAISFFTFRIGRKWTIIMGNIAAVIGSIIQSTAYGIPQLVVGRIVTG